MAAVSQQGSAAVESYAAPAAPMGDLYPYAARKRLTAAEATGADGQVVELAWEDGSRTRLHALMLRDSCPCRRCRDAYTLERTLDQLAYPLEVAPERLSLRDDGTLEIRWSGDGHVSRYEAGWLEAEGRIDNAAGQRQIAFWGGGDGSALPSYDYGAILADPSAALAWLESLRDLGIAYVTGAPDSREALETLIDHVAFIRRTNFGTVFDVEAQIDTISNAYTAVALPLHTDLTNREYQPGYQLLHCLVNEAAGGESTYADGFRIAERLRREDAEAYRLLTTVPVVFRYHDRDYDYEHARPVLGLGKDGAVAEVRFNASLMRGFEAPVEESAACYRAYRRFLELTRDPAIQVKRRMRPGEIACMDNRRVMHGRAAFEPTTGKRHLRGAYMEREEVLSRIRVLRRIAA